jgi:hypothetical protein
LRTWIVTRLLRDLVVAVGQMRLELAQMVEPSCDTTPQCCGQRLVSGRGASAAEDRSGAVRVHPPIRNR